MGHRPTTTVTSATLHLLLLIIVTTAMADDQPHSHNITTILAQHPQFSTFNQYLTTTGLADVINNQTDVTVCALNNSAMSELLSLHPTPTSLLRILLFHLFSHYSDADSLNSCCAWTLYPRPSGASNEVVDQTYDIGDGTISFNHPFTTQYSQLLGIIQQIPPHLSLLHVSTALPSPELRSLTSPVETLRNMTSAGCGAFAGAVAESAAAERWFRENAYVGMTVVCPIDAAWERFVPRFREMKEEEKVDLLLFHAIPVYHGKCEMRGGDMRDWRPATLTSYYRGNGGFGEPTVDMAAVGRLIVGVGLDEGGPLAIYPIQGVLLPYDPVGVVEYLVPNAPAQRAEVATEEECWFPRFLAPAPAPEMDVAADSGLVEDVNTADSTKLV